MKKTIKTLIIILILISVSNNVCLAARDASDIWGLGKDFIDLGITQNGGNIKIDDTAKATFEILIDFLWGIGLLTVVLSTVVLGIKYMLVLPSERSRIKQATYPYVIGVIIIFGAVTIWKLLINILDGSL